MDDENIKDRIKRKFKLEFPNKIIDLSTNLVGTWTMVYDEGFEIKIG